MSVFVHLQIVPERIDAKRWQVMYLESLALLSRYPGRLMGVRREKAWDSERAVFTSAIERSSDDAPNRHWMITGDFESMSRGDRIALYADLRHYQSRQETGPDEPDGKPLDILRDRDTEYRESVFSGNTGNRPYLIPVLACAMLVEQAFPGDALVSGTFSVDHALRAQALIRQVLHREVPLPVVADSERLWHRVNRFATDKDLLDRFEERYCGTLEEIHLELRKYAQPDLVACWWRDREADKQAMEAVSDLFYQEGGSQAEESKPPKFPTSIEDLGEMHNQALLDLVLRVQALREEGLSTEHPVFSKPLPEIKQRIVRLSDEHGVYLTESAWAWIDAEAELPVVSVIFLLMAINAHDADFYEIRWALLEQRDAMRHFAEITYKELN